ncbi:MAG: isocitrate/isopropylmalate dehydrogenase family protein [Candidatus Hydrothermarchaeota archaeon]|jgi:3-isopropylmalate dehydrogenase|nr:isocitrate/isopropylmalate dehydrogenase family protein [Candidatus Hydrothermarchaeota archaeon]
MYRITVIQGDGVGPEVIAEGIKVLEAAGDSLGINFEWKHHPYGAEHYLKTGEVLPDEALVEMKESDAIYLGAVGDPRVKPGILEKELLLKLRFYFDQYVNLRPIKLYPGVPCPLKDKGPEHVNFYVVRENTEDFYVGVGGRFAGSKHENSIEIKRSLYRAKFGLTTTKNGDGDIAYQLGVVSEEGSRRVIEYAFQLAEKKGMNRVTSVDKANVLTHVYSLWRDVFDGVAKSYSGIEIEYAFVDAITMWFIKNPEWYRVVVTPNMFGDIITDLGAMIQGGMGLAPGGNINPDGVSMFEPIHGSAPKYKGQGIADPLATILAGQMMLENLGEEKAAVLVEEAVIEVLKEGRVRTKDIGGNSRTSEMGDAVAEKVITLS